jgi:Zn-finger nucleic acid-binding protein
MNCPRDGEHLSRVRISGIELGKCPQCAGIWLDYGELEDIAQQHLTEVESHFEEISVDTDFESCAVKGYMRCPRCPDDRLQQITYTYMHSIKVNRCEQCLGLWLDCSELDAILGEERELEEEFSIRRLRPYLHSMSMALRRH